MSDLLNLLAVSIFISLATFSGGAQAYFYQYGVLQNHWLSRADLAASLAFGNATPGPAVFTTATFIGYHLAGVPGAIVGTIGVFIMPFLLALTAAKYLSHLLTNPHAAQTIQGIGLAAAGFVAATAFGLLRVSDIVWWQAVIAVTALVISIRWRVNPALILLVGGLFGLALS